MGSRRIRISKFSTDVELQTDIEREKKELVDDPEIELQRLAEIYETERIE